MSQENKKVAAPKENVGNEKQGEKKEHALYAQVKTMFNDSVVELFIAEDGEPFYKKNEMYAKRYARKSRQKLFLVKANGTVEPVEIKREQD